MTLQRRDLFRATVAGLLAKVVGVPAASAVADVVVSVQKKWVGVATLSAFGWTVEWSGRPPPGHRNHEHVHMTYERGEPVRGSVPVTHDGAIIKETPIGNV